MMHLFIYLQEKLVQNIAVKHNNISTWFAAVKAIKRHILKLQKLEFLMKYFIYRPFLYCAEKFDKYLLGIA